MASAFLYTWHVFGSKHFANPPPTKKWVTFQCSKIKEKQHSIYCLHFITIKYHESKYKPSTSKTNADLINQMFPDTETLLPETVILKEDWPVQDFTTVKLDILNCTAE